MNNLIIKNRGFTLIETLVGVSILMIAIAGPLTVANRGYTAALNAKSQSIAINLAQETIEYISYLKDNQHYTWGSWQPGTTFDSTVQEPYRSCVDPDNPCWQLNDLADLPPGFFREYYFLNRNPYSEILLVSSVIWNDGQGSSTIRVTLTQTLTNQQR